MQGHTHTHTHCNSTCRKSHPPPPPLPLRSPPSLLSKQKEQDVRNLIKDNAPHLPAFFLSFSFFLSPLFLLAFLMTGSSEKKEKRRRQNMTFTPHLPPCVSHKALVSRPLPWSETLRRVAKSSLWASLWKIRAQLFGKLLDAYPLHQAGEGLHVN